MADIIYGINPVREALRGRLRRPLELLVEKQAPSARLGEILEEASAAGVPVRYRQRQDLERLAGNRYHQGVVLLVEPFDYAPFEAVLEAWKGSGRPALLLALDSITDPHNLGAMVRSADAAGCQGVIVPKDRACPVTGVVDKSAAGALAHVPLCRVTNLARTLDELREQGVWIYGLAGEEEAVSLYQADLRQDSVLVIGSEGTGLRPNVRRRCDSLLSIPMAGGVSSLNASVAAGVALFEAVRQRGG